MQTTKLGHIPTSRTGEYTHDPMLTLVAKSGSTQKFDLSCPNYTCEFQDLNVLYRTNMMTEDNRLLTVLKGFQYVIKIKMNISDGEQWRDLQAFLNKFDHVRYAYDTNGKAHPDRRLFYYPPGDMSRPIFEVASMQKQIRADYIGDRYIGVTNYDILLIGQELYSNRLPSWQWPVGFVIPDFMKDHIYSATGREDITMPVYIGTIKVEA